MAPTADSHDPERAGPGDAGGLTELARRAYEGFIPIMKAVPLPMTADYAALINDAEVWVIRSGDGIAASLVLVAEGDHLMIESIAVDPGHQGSGLGRRMLDWAHLRARQMNMPEIRLYTNVFMPENRAWYKRAGYTETHQEQRGDKRIVHMCFKLQGPRPS
ncbi:GNAT family N-acetyltransferase [Roseibium sp. MMSF_3544]|uniref:GNAT family N-acetyltransferase n=1 Tax=unclassified Roseibium TaxID=2629323 RepID=UPI00273FA1B4|nr:GNAT family N-acetyltransferase [Roseibium sp. MMSF_3544]